MLSQEGTPESGDDSDRSVRGSSQPRSETLNLDQIRNMSTAALLRTFTETDFDEVKRKYCYSCFLTPAQCSAKFQSFGNENKAKKEMRKHLEEHLDKLIKAGNDDFEAEPVLALKKKQKESSPAVVVKTNANKKKIKSETTIVETVNTQMNKDNIITEEIIENQESKQHKRVKKESDVGDSHDEPPHVEVKLEQAGQLAQASAGSAAVVDDVIDEDHCYAQPGRVKAEYWPDFTAASNAAATAFTSIQVTSSFYPMITYIGW